MPTSYVNSTLLPDETVIYAAEVHWAVYLKPAFCALLGAIVVAVSPPELAAGMGWLFTFLTALLVINAVVIRTTTELDFAQIRWGFVSAWECSSGEACRVEQAVGERSGDFYHVPALA